MRSYNSFLTANNASQIVSIYRDYIKDPTLIDQSWHEFFSALQPEELSILADYDKLDWSKKSRDKNFDQTSLDQAISDSLRLIMMIRAYREIGHLIANLDPLNLATKNTPSGLDPEYYGFQKKDFNRKIFLFGYLGFQSATVQEVFDKLQSIYTGTLSIEYKHIQSADEYLWLKNRIEDNKDMLLTPRGKRTILERLISAEYFEEFLHTKYRGTKRFGLDGAESTIPALEQILKRSSEYGIQDFSFACAHRGRLNILANIVKKPHIQIFSEFIHGGENALSDQGSGDVKYHLGASSDRSFGGNLIHVSMAANPSHLEAVNPVVAGKIRAKQASIQDKNNDKVSGLLIHGDAAIAGQGIVAETFTMSQLNGYRIGGLIHFIINNQIGFTTSPQYSRSAPYSSEIGKIVQSPIFHVNGDDPEAVVLASRAATEFRNTFKKDTLVDMFCYRKHGHNEGDEPSFTQPLMYQAIKKKKSVASIYSQKLIDQEIVTNKQLEFIKDTVWTDLEKKFEKAKNYKVKSKAWRGGQWSGISIAPKDPLRRGRTAESAKSLRDIGEKITKIPKGFNLHPKLVKFNNSRLKAITSGKGIDWSFAEALSFGALLKEGYKVRLAGQDSGRGTFSQRHSVFYDQKTEERYIPLNNVFKKQKEFEVIDSFLSELGVLGFEYGYSLADPNTLVLWEAQFGDFANGAQIIIDQFITAGERKWMQMSGLVLLLPHGHEGMGPEHSSARIERFLQMAAEDNIQILNCTTPASYFHALRRQIHRNFRKPLILFTPKSTLRHPSNTSSIEEFTGNSSFHRIIDEEMKNPKRIIFCSGKFFYELDDYRKENKIKNIKIVRIEQLYPFPFDTLGEVILNHKESELLWVQEEPKNMGAWGFVKSRIRHLFTKHKINQKIHYVGRRRAAAPATGIAKRHNINQNLIKQISLQAPLKNVIKERIGVSFMKFKNLPRD
ncbi:2-oxoglutarate dehydrogenase E1 component [Alphaproteobacteria bacterium]|nr:2-oxoglutarate dehydrogenase E1 component [Alphaproteobacteria bacterium]